MTKKQIKHLDRPDTMFESLMMQMEKKKEKPVVPVQPRVYKQEFHNFVKKRKPKQIMLETRDEETGEIIKQLVDKVRRNKVTRLKKAIIAARNALK